MELTFSQKTGRIGLFPLTRKQWQNLGSQSLGLSPEELEVVQRMRPLSRFHAKSGEVLTVLVGDRCLHLLGLGKTATTAEIRRTIAAGVALLPEGESWSLRLPHGTALGPQGDLLRAAAEGALLSGYQFQRKAERAIREPAPGSFWAEEGSATTARQALQQAQAISAGVRLTRDLVNTPAGELGPQELSGAAVEVAERYGWRVTVLPQAELEERGMGLIAAVGKGSARPPVMTVIESAAGSHSPLGLVGKGVIFDSGGLNLKSTANMLLMRKDMAGAATVIGALEAIGQLQLAVPFVAVIPAAENSVGPQSYRPGDILTSLEGLTVEISNTDAEGRLLLADGLTLARQRGCRHLVDVATLTGSARIALGPDVPALFGSDEQLVTWLLEESRRADEPVWRLPLVEHYDRQLDSPWADVNHISSDARGGAITAALFLQRFSGGLPWAHMDLYGWEDQGKPETPKGANGMLVRTLVGLLQRFSAHIAK